MVGKTFKGMTDDLLRWQTERFLGARDRPRRPRRPRPARAGRRDRRRRRAGVDPLSRRGRAPVRRVKRYRADKAAADADTIDAVRSHALARLVQGRLDATSVLRNSAVWVAPGARDAAQNFGGVSASSRRCSPRVRVGLQRLPSDDGDAPVDAADGPHDGHHGSTRPRPRRTETVPATGIGAIDGPATVDSSFGGANPGWRRGGG